MNEESAKARIRCQKASTGLARARSNAVLRVPKSFKAYSKGIKDRHACSDIFKKRFKLKLSYQIAFQFALQPQKGLYQNSYFYDISHENCKVFVSKATQFHQTWTPKTMFKTCIQERPGKHATVFQKLYFGIPFSMETLQESSYKSSTNVSVFYLDLQGGLVRPSGGSRSQTAF